MILATHNGMFDVTNQPATKICVTNDLMGFTGGTDHGVLYASGHPGEGSSLPNTIRLIRSTGAGKTWEQLSRQGESDFHALTAIKSGIVGYDGTLRTSTDGKTWTTVESGPVVQFAAFASSAEAVGVEQDGTVHTSADAGATWIRKGKIQATFQAVAAVKNPEAKPAIWAATASGLAVSTDDGMPFRPVVAS